MHAHLELVLPPTDSIEDAIAAILAPFNENSEGANHPFWDWYVIGGRWAGEKWRQSLAQDKLATFKEWLVAEGVTVSGFQAGKQKLDPESQIAKVDAKWNAVFPPADGALRPCPPFAHSNDQYAAGLDGTLLGDVDTLAASRNVTCARVIIAGPSHQDAPEGSNPWVGPLRAVYMIADDAWNGVNFMPVAWDRTVGSAVAAFAERLENCNADYAAAVNPQDNWLVVTVDYHN